MKRIELTAAMRDALAAIERAERAFVPGVDGRSLVEIPKLALADATLAQLRLAKLPRPRPAVAVLTSRRRRRA